MIKPKTQYIIYAESSPNPKSMRFVSDKVLINNNKSYEFFDIYEAEVCPLAAALFGAFSFVNKVYIASNWLTITIDDSTEWSEETLEIRLFLLDYLGDDNPVIDYEKAVSTLENIENDKQLKGVYFKKEEDYNIIDKQIVAVMEDYIDPIVAGDGGKIEFVNFHDGIVEVILRGACYGCPARDNTLKNGLETILSNEIPAVKSVVAINY